MNGVITPRLARGQLPMLGLVLWALVGGGGLASAQGGPFSIANSPNYEGAISIANDGSNFLVALQGSPSLPDAVGAQLVSPAGTLVGSLISTGHTGGAPMVDYSAGAGKYLLVWDEYRQARDIVAWFIDPTGGLSGSLIPITQTALDEDIIGVVSDGSGFLVAYLREVSPGATQTQVYARMVDFKGTVGPEIAVSNGLGGPAHRNADCVAFDGSNFLIVWLDGSSGSEVRGRLLSPLGILGSEFSINASAAATDNVFGVAYNGTNHIVLWTDEVGGPGSEQWDLFGQLVSPKGTLVGGVITVCDAPGRQWGPFVASDGSNWIVTWTDMRNDANGNWQCDAGEGTCWDIFGRLLDSSGLPMGVEWPIVADSGDQFASPTARGVGKYLMTWIEGSFQLSTGDVWGVILPTSNLSLTYCTGKLNSQFCLPMPSIGWNGWPSLSDPIPFDISASQVINNKNGIFFYGTAGRANIQFHCATLCVKPPLKRTPVQNSAGNPPPPDCSGTFSFDFNSWMQGGSDPNLTPGTQVDGQYWYRDPQEPCSGTGLTNAIEFFVWP